MSKGPQRKSWGRKAGRPYPTKEELKKRASQLIFNHNLTPKEKACLTVVIQDAFGKSCAERIESAIEHGFCKQGGDIRTMALKMKGSPFSIAGGVVYRVHHVCNTEVYEVLFLAVRPFAKRRNLACHIVQELRTKLLAASEYSSRMLCVSIKDSNEAWAFWRFMGLRRTSEGDEVAKQVADKMITFDDFDPVYMYV